MFSRSCDFPPCMGCCCVRCFVVFFLSRGDLPRGPFFGLNYCPYCRHTKMTAVESSDPSALTVLYASLERSLWFYDRSYDARFSISFRVFWAKVVTCDYLHLHGGVPPVSQGLFRIWNDLLNSNDNVLGTWKTILYWVCWVPIVFLQHCKVKVLLQRW